MMGVVDTSLEAWTELKESGRLGERQEQVFKAVVALSRTGGATDKEISGLTGLPINAVTPRRNELVEKGIVCSGGKVVRGGRRCYIWKVS